MSTIYYQDSAGLSIGPDRMNGGVLVSLFRDGTVIVSMTTHYAAVTMEAHMDAPSLRAFAALLNEAVEKLPAEAEAA